MYGSFSNPWPRLKSHKILVVLVLDGNLLLLLMVHLLLSSPFFVVRLRTVYLRRANCICTTYVCHGLCSRLAHVYSTIGSLGIISPAEILADKKHFLFMCV